jgi:hypothetical protein
VVLAIEDAPAAPAEPEALEDTDEEAPDSDLEHDDDVVRYKDWRPGQRNKGLLLRSYWMGPDVKTFISRA